MQFNCAYTELVSISKLVPNPKNANKHPPEQIERLAKIIDFQGQRSPIVVSKRSGFITKGHGRLMAMQKLEWEQVAVDYQDYLSEAQEYADIIADNEIARWAKFDLEMVKIDMGKVEDLDIELLGIELFTDNEWGSDIGKIEKIEENLDGVPARITIECHQDMKDEVLIYIKAKFLETSFEGVHVK
jgi:ParB-like chromosome segregation protein Spo0J